MGLDYTLFQWINNLAGHVSWLDQIMVIYSKYGPILFGIVLMGIWFSTKDRDSTENRKAVIYAVLATLIALFVNQIIGHIYFRPRPFSAHIVTLLLDKSLDPSFPSDHATGGFALALTILWKNRKFGWGMLIMAVLLGFSRVYVGTHYPLDIVGGATTGMVGMLLIKWQYYRLEPLVNWVLNRYKQVETLALNKEM